jgi:hypothetical protein
MLNAMRDNPKRPPNWRWLRAVQIDGGGLRATRALDGPDGFAWIRRALRLKRHFEQANNRADAMYAALYRDRPLFWAHSIWSDDRAPSRWAIEARILAGESNKDIADKLGTNEEIIDAYANVFFDVREKIYNTDYVVNVVMGDAVTRGLQERHYDLLWKLLGYRGGPHALDAAINRFVDVPKPENAGGVSNFFQDVAINSMKYKAAIASLSIPVNTHTQLPLIDSFVKYVEIEKNSDNASKSQATIVENIGAMLSSLPFKVGTKLDSVAIKMLPFDDGAAELRNDEMMVIAAGGSLENQTLVEELRFPEKTDAGTK